MIIYKNWVFDLFIIMVINFDTWPNTPSGDLVQFLIPVAFWFFQFCDVAKIGNHPQKYLANSGYKPNLNLKKRILLYSWLPSTYGNLLNFFGSLGFFFLNSANLSHLFFCESYPCNSNKFLKFVIYGQIVLELNCLQNCSKKICVNFVYLPHCIATPYHPYHDSQNAKP